MSSPLASQLGKHLQHAYTSINRLARLSGIPQRTIANWLDGTISKPHRWQSIAKVALALHLNVKQTDELLHSAGHLSLSSLRKISREQTDVELISQFHLPELKTPLFQVIADIPTFVGRSKELNELKNNLVSKGSKYLVYGIQGMGGVGKTTLATRLAYQVRDHFPDGILWARLDVSDTLSILDVFAKAYSEDLSQYKDIESKASIVRSILAKKNALIILDNAETSAQVRPLLPPSTGICKVLITTRHDLLILGGWKCIQLKPFNSISNETIELFKRHLGKAFVLTHYAEFLEIASLVGHLPLAVSIIAGQLADRSSLRIKNLINSLRNANLRLNSLAHDDREIRVSFDVSFASLTAFEQDIFSTLGIFSGETFRVDAVAYLVNSPPEEIEAKLFYLEKLSLVQKNQMGQWSLHPLLRDYAREKLKDGKKLKGVVKKTLEMYRDIENQTWNYAGSLDDEIPNAQYVFEQAGELKLHRPFLNTARALSQTLMIGAWFSTGRVILKQAYEIALKLRDREATIYMLHQLSLIEIGLGHIQNAEKNLQIALELAKSKRSQNHVIGILSALGKSKHDIGYRKEANFYFEKSLALARKINSPAILSSSLNNLGANIIIEGRFVEAKKMLLEALEISYITKGAIASHKVLMNLGDLSWKSGAYQQAESYWLEALSLARAGKYRSAIVALLASLAKLYILQNKSTEAENLCKEGIKLALEINSPRVESMIRSEFGYLLFTKNKFDEALEQLQQSSALALKAGDMEAKCIAQLYTGSLFLNNKQIKKRISF